MLSYNEIKPKKYIISDGEPYEVLDSHVFRKQQRKPVNQTKLRHLKTGKVVERSFHQSEKVEEAAVETRTITYLFKKPARGGGDMEYWFSEEGKPGKRFFVRRNVIGANPLFFKENTLMLAASLGGEITSVRPPVKVALAVAEAPPDIRGSTAQGGTKHAVLETGATVNVPLFVEAGDTVIVNTETGTYVERAK